MRIKVMKNVLWIGLSLLLLLTACGGPEYKVQGDVVVRSQWTFSFGTVCDTLQGADPATFVPVTDWLGHDSQRVYFKAQLVPGIDVATLKAVRYPLFSDKHDYYYEARPLHVADLPSFEIVKWLDDDFWAKDARLVYYDTLSIAGVDLATFELVGKWFARDKNHVYMKGMSLADADPASFEPMKGAMFYYRDKSHVWHFDRLLADADPSTFELVGEQYCRDKSHVWCSIDDKMLMGADPATFEVIGKSNYCRDKSHVWFRSDLLADVDYATFVVDYDSFAHDKFGSFTADRRDTDDSADAFSAGTKK